MCQACQAAPGRRVPAGVHKWMGKARMLPLLMAAYFHDIGYGNCIQLVQVGCACQPQACLLMPAGKQTCCAMF